MFDQAMISKIQSFIENEIESQVKKQFSIIDLEHNHPPLRFKVDNCAYCQKYGNVFERS